MSSHYGESNVRLRFTDYLNRFVRLAAHQEYSHTGSTKIGYPTTTFQNGQLGSGVVFADDQMRQREMWAHGHRIDAWRKTNSYKLFAKVGIALLIYLPWLIWIRIGIPESNAELFNLMFNTNSRAYE